MNNSPLGQYAAPVAAIVSLGIIGAWVVAEFLHGLSMLTTQPAGLKELALVAAGAIFGSAVAVNGYRAPVAAAHKRLDRIGAPPASSGSEG